MYVRRLRGIDEREEQGKGDWKSQRRGWGAILKGEIRESLMEKVTSD